MWKVLSLPGIPVDAGWQSAAELKLQAGHQLCQPEILFTKIEDEVIQKQIQKLPMSKEPETQNSNHKPFIGIDEFRKLDLRVAKVLSAEKIPKSDKLLKLQVSLGNEQRQVIAGIAEHYKPEDLVGKKIVVVSNLAPAKLMGQESQGMLLAASDSNGRLSIITVSGDIDEGSVIK